MFISQVVGSNSSPLGVMGSNYPDLPVITIDSRLTFLAVLHIKNPRDLRSEVNGPLDFTSAYDNPYANTPEAPMH
jgi:hypothetical protein